ncbi:MAG: hypothetical protein J7577_12255 [Sphingobacteriaceae bacterium]|nr:hypothetical protein [Sphingobacteriaceae bacterium]
MIAALAGLIMKFCTNLQIAGMAENYQEAVAALKQHQIDIIFMDIDLGNHTGFDL